LLAACAAFDLFRLRAQVRGLIRRDPRVVERKKPAQKKARKKRQWVKR
jgi:small subunit ribosomal protein S9